MEKRGDVDGLIEALSGDDIATSERAAKALARMGERAVDGLMEVLRNEDDKVRKKAAEILSRGEEPVIEKLIQMTKDGLPGAARCLEQIGGDKVRIPLVQALADQTSSLRQRDRVAEILARLGWKADAGEAVVLKPLIYASADEGSSDESRAEAVATLEKLGYRKVGTWEVSVQEAFSGPTADFYGMSGRAFRQCASGEACIRRLWEEVPKKVVAYPPPAPEEQYCQGEAILKASFVAWHTGEYMSGGRGYEFNLSINLHGEGTGTVFEKVYSGSTPPSVRGNTSLAGAASRALSAQLNNLEWILPKAVRFVLGDFSVLLDTRGGKKEKLASFLSSTSFSPTTRAMEAATCALKGDWERCAGCGAASVCILTLCLDTDDWKKCSRHLVAMGRDALPRLQRMIPLLSGAALERAQRVKKQIGHEGIEREG